jgi:hypothetical protein
METRSRAAEPEAIQRFVCVANPFGRVADSVFPTAEGLAAALPAILALLEPRRGKFTVLSDLDHGSSAGHGLTHTFLPGVKTSAAALSPTSVREIGSSDATGPAGRGPAVWVGRRPQRVVHDLDRGGPGCVPVLAASWLRRSAP